MDFSELKAYWNECAAKERAERESWAHPSMSEIFDLTIKLQDEGKWRDIIYCPKDGSIFLAWTPRMKTPFQCKYMGEWPNGSWWALCDGDMWPTQPVLFKEVK